MWVGGWAEWDGRGVGFGLNKILGMFIKEAYEKRIKKEVRT